MARRIAVLILLGALTAPAVAWAQQYPPAQGALTVDHTVVGPGGTVRASGSGCVGNATTSFRFDNAADGSTTANGSGAFSANVRIPSGASSGDHTLSSSCAAAGGGTRVLGANITVNRALPRTGSSRTVPLLVMAAGLLLVGLVLVVTVRNRAATKTPVT